MSKKTPLEKCKEAIIDQTLLALKSDPKKALENMFDAAIALNLPVLFMEFVKNNCVVSSDEGIFYPKFRMSENKGFFTSAEMYDYWIENIYKPE